MEYNFTEIAILDIEKSIKYIREDLKSPKAASKLFNKIQQEIDCIIESPFAYPSCEKYLKNDKNFRHALIDNYILIYKVNQDESVITFLRFLYGKRNISEDIIG